MYHSQILNDYEIKLRIQVNSHKQKNLFPQNSNFSANVQPVYGSVRPGVVFEYTWMLIQPFMEFRRLLRFLLSHRVQFSEYNTISRNVADSIQIITGKKLFDLGRGSNEVRHAAP